MTLFIINQHYAYAFLRFFQETNRLLIFQNLAQRAAGGEIQICHITDVIDGPAFAFTHHQHFIFPRCGCAFLFVMGKGYAQRDVAGIGVGNGRGAVDRRRCRAVKQAGEHVTIAGADAGFLVRRRGDIDFRLGLRF